MFTSKYFYLQGRNCETLSQVWEPWTSCIFTSEIACARGYKYRYSNCYYGQELVSSSKCKEIDVEAKSEECYKSCDKDCQVTNWKRWSTCSSTCGIAHKSRSRKIINQNVGKGIIIMRNKFANLVKILNFPILFQINRIF